MERDGPYSHFVARGVDVVFPKNTPMEIRFGTHDGSAPAHPSGKSASPLAKPERTLLIAVCMG